MQTGVTVGTNDPSIPNSVTRVLQHSILQLCNEHIGYNHTLQVLGVLCLTIDDRQHELVVKVNNTLKRVNPVTPPKDAPLQPPTVPRADQELCLSASEGPLMPEGSCPNGAFSAKTGDRVQAGVRGLSGGFLLGKARRRSHGRKQTNPVRVRHVYDEVDGEISGDDVLTVEPTNPEALCVPERQQLRGEVGGSLLSRKRIGGIRKVKRKLDDVFSTQGHDSAMAASTPAAPSLTARLAFCDSKDVWAAEAPRQSPDGATACQKTYDETVGRANVCSDLADESLDSECSRRLVVIAPDFSPENPDDPGTPAAEAGALNFSMCALNGGTPQPGKGDGGGGGATSAGTGETPAQNHAQEFPNCLPGDINGIRIKEEVKAMYPLGLDLAMSAGGFDVSQNLAIRTSFLGDPRFFPAIHHGSLTNGHAAASQNSLGSELCSTSNPALRYLGDAANIQLLDEAYLHSMVSGFSVAQVAMGPASYAISSCLKDGLTMHLTKTRTKDRSLLAGASTKVKDIIMYDDSAPLHTQKGSRIEGDFMLDSLNVEGKKRRRRTAEDTLTAEEIAEYMGSCERSQQCSFKCKYCSEVCVDLSRYFNHTLLKHNSFICHQCGKNFTTKSSLLRHRPIHTGMRRFACSICKKSFYRKDKCKAHIKRHLGLSSDYPDKYPPVNFATS